MIKQEQHYDKHPASYENEGAEVSQAEIAAAVAKAIKNAESKILTQRRAFNRGAFLGGIRRGKVLKVPDTATVRTEMNKQIDALLGPETEEDMKYLKTMAKSDVNNEFSEGSEVTEDQIAAAVSKAIRNAENTILAQRYAFNRGAFLGGIRRGRVLQVPDTATVRNEMNKQIDALLGPETEEDMKYLKTMAKSDVNNEFSEVTADQIAAAVSKAIRNAEDKIIAERHSFNRGAFLGGIRRGRVLQVPDTATVRTEMNKQIDALLGPETEEDMKCLKTLAKGDKDLVKKESGNECDVSQAEIAAAVAKAIKNAESKILTQRHDFNRGAFLGGIRRGKALKVPDTATVRNEMNKQIDALLGPKTEEVETEEVVW